MTGFKIGSPPPWTLSDELIAKYVYEGFPKQLSPIVSIQDKGYDTWQSANCQAWHGLNFAISHSKKKTYPFWHGAGGQAWICSDGSKFVAKGTQDFSAFEQAVLHEEALHAPKIADVSVPGDHVPRVEIVWDLVFKGESFNGELAEKGQVGVHWWNETCAIDAPEYGEPTFVKLITLLSSLPYYQTVRIAAMPMDQCAPQHWYFCGYAHRAIEWAQRTIPLA